jgi:hypothetical protein
MMKLLSTLVDVTLVDARQAVGELKLADGALARRLEATAGYAVFARVKKDDEGVGLRGTGVLFEKGAPTGNLVLQEPEASRAHRKEICAEFILFETEAALAGFKEKELGKAVLPPTDGAVPGAPESITPAEGVTVFTLARGRLRRKASVAAQRFSFLPFRAAPPAGPGEGPAQGSA